MQLELLTMRAATMIAVAALASPAGAQESEAARYLLDQQILEACEGRGGEIDPEGFIERDLTGDGRDDLIISHEKITCEGTGYPLTQSDFCGMQTCKTQFYIRVDDLLVLEEEFWAGGVEVGSTRVPVISGYEHGGGTWSMRWDGSRFR